MQQRFAASKASVMTVHLCSTVPMGEHRDRCGADSFGKVHGAGCSIGRCKAHGEPRDQCFGDGRHSATTYWGVYPGTIEALKRGWTIKSKGAIRPDLNRVLSDLTWDPDTEQFA
jgi:hypothetical protein